ncbi:hypothetical protein ES703_117609 [subsurface metagenome]
MVGTIDINATGTISYLVIGDVNVLKTYNSSACPVDAYHYSAILVTGSTIRIFSSLYLKSLNSNTTCFDLEAVLIGSGSWSIYHNVARGGCVSGNCYRLSNGNRSG